MNITLKCFASLARFTPADAEAYPIGQGETPGSVAARLGIPMEEIKLVFVNGTHAGLSAPLKDGDRLGLFPAVGGG